MKKRTIRFALATLAALPLTLGIMAASALAAPAAQAPGATQTQGMMGDDWCAGGIWDGTGAWAGTGMWGTGFGAHWLADNPDALQAWLQLRADHLAALQTWYETYKTDLTSAEAQQALHDLWTTFWSDMKAFYEQYGNGATWTCPSDGMWSGWQHDGMMGDDSYDARHMWGSGYGAAWMLHHPRAFGRWLTMRAAHTADAEHWWQQHSADPAGTAAQTALHAMHAQHRAQVRAFYTHHHLAATTSRMRHGAGGWMGLGGMWGGWGW